MKIELLTICDHAVDYHGKTCVLGMFDGVSAVNVPAVHPHCTILARIRFYSTEATTHKVAVSITDEDGRPIFQPPVQEIHVQFGELVQSVIVNLLFNINNLKLEKFGEYAVNLVVNGEQRNSTPLYLRQSVRKQ